LRGAQVWNASVASKIPVKDLVTPFDSVAFCLNKKLDIPMESVLCGKLKASFLTRRRKVLGGGMRQVGVIAAAGLVVLEKTVPRLAEDHKRAITIARLISWIPKYSV